MTLNEHIDKFIQKHNLLSRGNELLLAVSGGVDSMVLMDLLNNAELKFAVAHVHYRLRDASADEMHLVKHRCLLKNITCHTYEVSDEERDEMKAGNLQEKARDIRYNFFKELQREYGYAHILTAHHLDDQIEGFFLRLLRSSGLEGLSGMSENDDFGLLRPLLLIPKSMLLEYAASKKLPFLEDTSNRESNYDRNYLRNEVLSTLEKRFPEYRQSISSSIDHLGESSRLLLHLNIEIGMRFVVHYDNRLDVNRIEEIKRMPAPHLFLWHLIRPYGFNVSTAGDMLSSDTGAMFYSHSYQALRDRDRIVIRSSEQRQGTMVIIDNIGIHSLNDNLDILINEVDNMVPADNNDTEYFDLEKVAFPLTIREWRPGDRFSPIGMKGHSKKVKDYLTDEKVPRTDKEAALVVTTDGDIIWLLGRRMDDRYKVTKETSRILMMKLLHST